MLTRRHRPARRGMTVVETALVLGVFLVLLFGMFEYCRFLLVLHVTNNAAREGARYASVNLDKPANFPTADYTDSANRVYPSVTRYTTERMGGLHKNIEGFRIAVFSVDQAGLDLTTAVVRPKTKSTANPKVYPSPWSPADSNHLPWNSAPFPDRIAVYINGTYRPLLPTFLLMPETISIDVYALTGGEG